MTVPSEAAKALLAHGPGAPAKAHGALWGGQHSFIVVDKPSGTRLPISNFNELMAVAASLLKP